MNLNEKFMSEWREDAEMSDDLFDDARKIPILCLLYTSDAADD